MKRRQIGAVVVPVNDKNHKASAPRKPTGKPPAGGAKAQTKTAANATRQAKDKVPPKQKPTQNAEGSTTKGPTQRVIRRVHAVVDVPIKTEEDEDELWHTPTDDIKARALLNGDPKPSKTVKKTARAAELPREKSKSWQVYREDDNNVTPPATVSMSKRRKSGVDQDYYEPSEDVHDWRNLENANVRHRPPARRKSIRDLRESDFEYHEEEDEEEETDADELNLGVGCPLTIPFWYLAQPSCRGALSMVLIWRDP